MVSKAQQRAVHKYIKSNYDRMEMTVKKGGKGRIEKAAQAQGESVNGYIKKAVCARIKAETGEEIEL